MSTRITYLIGGALLTVLLTLGASIVAWTAPNTASSPSVAVAQDRVSAAVQQNGGDAQPSRASTIDTAMSMSTDNASTSTDLAQQIRLPNALEGLDTTEYRITMMLCEEKY